MRNGHLNILKSSISIENVTFAYDESKDNAIDGITMHVKAGEHVALVGPSGGGKTIFASLIARAFLKDAPIILMDEATASLDVDNESAIQESISKQLKAQNGIYRHMVDLQLASEQWKYC